METPPWWVKLIWKRNWLAKNKFFSWLLLNRKALTWDKLNKRSFACPRRCSLCKQQEESRTHLLLSYSYTIEVWTTIKSTLKFSSEWRGETIQEAFHSWWENLSLSKFRGIPPMIFWEFWNSINKAIFEKKSIPPQQFFSYHSLNIWFRPMQAHLVPSHPPSQNLKIN